MNLLVAGAVRVDAGKTTFSTGLTEYVGGVGFKPRAGNDYWYHHDDYRRAVDDGRLYGKDARRLAAVAGAGRPESINPVHRLWTPSAGPGTGLLGQADREFLVDRVGDGEAATYVRNATADLPASAEAALPLEEAVAVDSLTAFNRAMERLHVPALEALGERVARADRAVVESYGDVARPLQGYEPDAAAVVQPRRVRVYDGARYAKACEVASGSAQEGRLEERVGDVTDVLEPRATLALPPLGADSRSEPAAVAEAYEHAYEAVVATALESG
jgi:predicted P-loop ATPase/GTPase